MTALRGLGDRRGICRALEGFGILAIGQSQMARGAKLLGASEAVREAIGAPLPVSDRAHYAFDRAVAAACAALGEEAFSAAWAVGRAMTLEEATEYAPSPEEVAPSATGRKVGLLTAREQEAAALVAQGLTNREIASRLGIAERTAEGHVQSILNKLAFNSRAQIAAWAVAQGFHTVSKDERAASGPAASTRTARSRSRTLTVIPRLIRTVGSARPASPIRPPSGRRAPAGRTRVVVEKS